VDEEAGTRMVSDTRSECLVRLHHGPWRTSHDVSRVRDSCCRGGSHAQL